MNEKNTFTYKSFEGSIDFSLEDQCLYGQILFIRDTVLYHATTIPELEQAFCEAVDQYLEDCKALGRQPNKPHSGTFNVRIGSERHRALASHAHRKDVSINSVLIQCIDKFIEDNLQNENSITMIVSAEIAAKDDAPRWQANKPSLRLVGG